MRVGIAMLALALVLTVAAPAFAATGSGGAGRDFGQHHATHAQDMGGFTGIGNADPEPMNPGMHRGFSGWTAP